MKRKRLFGDVVLNVLMYLMVFLAVYPLILMVLGSLKTASELSANPAGFPMQPTLENYAKLFTHSGSMLSRSLFNSLFTATVTTLLTLAVAAMAAYAFAKCDFKGKNFIFMMLFATMLVPTEITIPPLYIIFSKIGWLNSYQVQIFPFIANVFALFMMRQFMGSIPNAVVEAARIDGASHWKAFSRVVVPCSMPVISALGILVFLGRWGDYLWPTLMISKIDYAPVMQVLPILNDGSGNMRNIPWEVILAGCAIVTIPVIIIFYLFQEQFMSSATLGAVKE